MLFKQGHPFEKNAETVTKLKEEQLKCFITTKTCHIMKHIAIKSPLVISLVYKLLFLEFY